MNHEEPGFWEGKGRQIGEIMRICFLLKVRPERVEEYRDRHAGRIFGSRRFCPLLLCKETVFSECALAGRDGALFEGLENGSADDYMKPLQEVFHLD